MAFVSPNFAFLAKHDPLLVNCGAKAEELCFADPPMALGRLRMLTEMLAKQAAAHTGISVTETDDLSYVIGQLKYQGVLKYELAQIFHGLRIAGNAALHEGQGSKGDALHQLKMARTVAVWFHRSFGHDPSFKPGPFIPPTDPAEADEQLKADLEKLKAEVAKRKGEAAEAKKIAEEEAELREAAEEEAKAAQDEALAALELAEESEKQAAQIAAEKTQLEATLAKLQAQKAAAPPAEIYEAVEQAMAAAEDLDLDEADTRRLIDAQLRETGWDADTEELTYVKGVRPHKGKNQAISEWPVKGGRADYVLFAGLTPIGVVEAKRKTEDVSGAISQSKRYSRKYVVRGEEKLPDGGPWGEYKVPFLFATNGRPFLKQIETKSGIWFQDVRKPTNHSRALNGWPTPEGLVGQLAQDVEASKAKLEVEPTDYLGLRDYQIEAVKSVEAALVTGQRNILVAMATGTGKTRTCIGLTYRLIKSKMFRRVLFLVDRSALGEQATNAFKDVRLENLQSFVDIYDVKEMGDLKPEPDTRLHIATIQGMMHRLLYPSDDDQPIPVDQYDCIVVDECHRGYNLDREMSDAELTFRSEKDYVSKYRRVLEHFDAAKVGLTATPALHTSEIFGEPTYQYSYRQAVIDGWLVDHEPPIRIITALAEDGMTWKVGEEMAVYDTKSTQLELFKVPDEVHIEIEQYNRRVITENFNRSVCRELAKRIDPSLEGKTLVYCVNDAHADLVVKLLKEAFEEQYGSVDDGAIEKITGKADKPLSLIRHYKNERLPNVAVTVDLLTTGIDVPEIVNLVFIRRVRSRILYEQMLGRATRLCPAIGKESFRIFDAVDIYAALKSISDMKPVVVRPNISFKQLCRELAELEDDQAAQEVLDQLVAKLQTKKRRLSAEQLEKFETITRMTPDELIKKLKGGTPQQAASILQPFPSLPGLLDQVAPKGGRKLIVSGHKDEVRRVERGYGKASKPEDFIESFGQYIKDNLNTIPALLVVTQKPRELTRQQLKELKLLLDEQGYSETALNTAWREWKNEDIAASIIGFIRQQALGSTLMSYDERVDAAMKRIMTSRSWTQPQRKWLTRIAKQIKQETIVDREALDRGQFKAQGGFKRLDKVFEGKLEELLGDISEELWTETA